MSDDEFWTEFGDRLAMMTTEQLRLFWRLATLMYMGALQRGKHDGLDSRRRLAIGFRAWRDDPQVAASEGQS